MGSQRRSNESWRDRHDFDVVFLHFYAKAFAVCNRCGFAGAVSFTARSPRMPATLAIPTRVPRLRLIIGSINAWKVDAIAKTLVSKTLSKTSRSSRYCVFTPTEIPAQAMAISRRRPHRIYGLLRLNDRDPLRRRQSPYGVQD